MSRGTCPLSPGERAVCRYKRPYSDVHHTFYPSADYSTRTEKEFRELPINKERLCRCVHDAIHATQEAPEKPSREDMLNAIAEQAIRGTGDTAA